MCEDFEQLWENFIDLVHRDARLKEGSKVENLIGGVEKFKKLMEIAYKNLNKDGKD